MCVCVGGGGVGGNSCVECPRSMLRNSIACSLKNCRDEEAKLPNLSHSYLDVLACGILPDLK